MASSRVTGFGSGPVDSGTPAAGSAGGGGSSSVAAAAVGTPASQATSSTPTTPGTPGTPGVHGAPAGAIAPTNIPLLRRVLTTPATQEMVTQYLALTRHSVDSIWLIQFMAEAGPTIRPQLYGLVRFMLHFLSTSRPEDTQVINCCGLLAAVVRAATAVTPTHNAAGTLPQIAPYTESEAIVKRCVDTLLHVLRSRSEPDIADWAALVLLVLVCMDPIPAHNLVLELASNAAAGDDHPDPSAGKSSSDPTHADDMRASGLMSTLIAVCARRHTHARTITPLLFTLVLAATHGGEPHNLVAASMHTLLHSADTARSAATQACVLAALSACHKVICSTIPSLNPKSTGMVAWVSAWWSGTSVEAAASTAPTVTGVNLPLAPSDTLIPCDAQVALALAAFMTVHLWPDGAKPWTARVHEWRAHVGGLPLPVSAPENIRLILQIVSYALQSRLHARLLCKVGLWLLQQALHDPVSTGVWLQPTNPLVILFHATSLDTASTRLTLFRRVDDGTEAQVHEERTLAAHVCRMVSHCLIIHCAEEPDLELIHQCLDVLHRLLFIHMYHTLSMSAERAASASTATISGPVTGIPWETAVNALFTCLRHCNRRTTLAFIGHAAYALHCKLALLLDMMLVSMRRNHRTYLYYELVRHAGLLSDWRQYLPNMLRDSDTAPGQVPVRIALALENTAVAVRAIHERMTDTATSEEQVRSIIEKAEPWDSVQVADQRSNATFAAIPQDHHGPLVAPLLRCIMQSVRAHVGMAGAAK